MKIVNNVSKLRKEKKLTQEELALALGVSRQTIISIEDNKSNITLEMAYRIALFFNLKIDNVFEIKSNDEIYDRQIDDINGVINKYGKYTIIIKDNMVYRCSTGVLEIGPKGLIEYKLPNYGKMKKLIIINNNVYLLKQTRDYINRNDIVLHNISDKLNISNNIIDFDEKKAWNYIKNI